MAKVCTAVVHITCVINTHHEFSRKSFMSRSKMCDRRSSQTAVYIYYTCILYFPPLREWVKKKCRLKPTRLVILFTHACSILEDTEIGCSHLQRAPRGSESQPPLQKPVYR